jgi:hypothetical protein
MNERGSSLIESIFAIQFMTVVLATLFIVVAHSFTKNVLHFALYESMICYFEERPYSICIREGRNKIQSSLPFLKVQEFQLSRRFLKDHLYGKISVITYFNKRFDYELSMENPSRGRH